jgi:hypothetical protein
MGSCPRCQAGIPAGWWWSATPRTRPSPAPAQQHQSFWPIAWLAANQNREDCDAATTQRVQEAYDKGRAVCMFRPSTKEWWIGSNDDGSDVFAFVTFDSPTTAAAAVDGWAKLV